MQDANLKILGFHTCKNTGGRETVLECAPFFSKARGGNKQWLSDGYYFWTDSDHYAHEWAKLARFKEGFIIIKALICLKKEQLLDLVGSVDDQRHFQALIEWMRKNYEKVKSENHALPQLDFENENISDFVTFLRYINLESPGVFDYSAIKAQDSKQEEKVKFTPNGWEFCSLVTRQQICIFSDPERFVFDKKIHFES